MNAKWTKEEEILALYAYCHVPFNRAYNSNPWIIKIANLIGRTPAAVKMKIGNLGAFDPQLKAKGITGLTGTSKLDEEIWNEYYGHWDKLVIDAELIMSRLGDKEAEETQAAIDHALPQGSEAIALVKRRINQQFFRSAVLSAYDNRCCISNIANSKLLEACHIVAWNEDESIRTDPTNGLCMTSTFHRAYDKLLISITPEYILQMSDEFLTAVKDAPFADTLHTMNGNRILLPEKFSPNPEYLAQHYEKFRSAN